MATASGSDAWWPTSSVVQASRPVCWPRCSAETAKIDSAITHSGRSSRVDDRGADEQRGDQRDEAAGEEPQAGRRRQRRTRAGLDRLDERGDGAERVGRGDPGRAGTGRVGAEAVGGRQRRQDGVDDHRGQEAERADGGAEDDAGGGRRERRIDDLDPERAEVPGQAEQRRSGGAAATAPGRRRADGDAAAGAQHRAEQQPVERGAQQEADDVDERGEGRRRHREIVSCQG